MSHRSTPPSLFLNFAEEEEAARERRRRRRREREREGEEECVEYLRIWITMWTKRGGIFFRFSSMASAVWNIEATILLGSPSIQIPPIQFHHHRLPPSLSPLSFFAERATSSPLSNPSIKVPSLSVFPFLFGFWLILMLCLISENSVWFLINDFFFYSF